MDVALKVTSWDQSRSKTYKLKFQRTGSSVVALQSLALTTGSGFCDTPTLTPQFGVDVAEYVVRSGNAISPQSLRFAVGKGHWGQTISQSSKVYASVESAFKDGSFGKAIKDELLSPESPSHTGAPNKEVEKSLSSVSIVAAPNKLRRLLATKEETAAKPDSKAAADAKVVRDYQNP